MCGWKSKMKKGEIIIKSTGKNFKKLMGSQFNQYIVPIYQRTYSWEEKQY